MLFFEIGVSEGIVSYSCCKGRGKKKALQHQAHTGFASQNVA